MTSSPAYVREPETNGCSERFVRTLKEQLLWLMRFDAVEELNRALQEFKDKLAQFYADYVSDMGVTIMTDYEMGLRWELPRM